MDKNKVVMIAVGAFIVGGLVVGASGQMGGHGWDNDRGHNEGMSRQMHTKIGGDTGQNDSRTTGTQDINTGMGMMNGNNDMGMGGLHDMNMMVGSEREFLQKMIPHHEEAITTAKEVLVRGGSTPEIKMLAENIIDTQEAEVTSMKTWYKSWYGTDYVVSANYQPMMRPLESLTGAELDKVFLADMIVHHKGAIMMTESVSSHIEHPEIMKLASAIKTTQTAEISEMQLLLDTLN